MHEAPLPLTTNGGFRVQRARVVHHGRMSVLTSLRTRIGSALGVASQENSRGIARERLSIILAHQRGDVLLEGIDLKALQAEVFECVKVGAMVDSMIRDADSASFCLRKLLGGVTRG